MLALSFWGFEYTELGATPKIMIQTLSQGQGHYFQGQTQKLWSKS